VHPSRDTRGFLPRIEESVQARNWLCGTPTDAIALLKELEAKYPGVERVIVSFAMGTPQAVCQEQLRHFVRKSCPLSRRLMHEHISASGGATMDFYEMLDQVLALLRSRGRVTYGALKRQFNLADAFL
jgi:hypothetical protein